MLLAALSWAQSNEAPAQNPPDSSQSGAVLTKLFPPVYPPLARQARIIGDVKIQLRIRRDGAIESAEVISGHPMLKQAALDSAQNSEFQCAGCGDLATPIGMTYTFDLAEAAADPDPCCCSHPSQQKPPLEAKVSQSDGHVDVRVPASPVCMCPDQCEAKWAEEHSRFRSLQCFYLWKCGHRTIYIQ